jgi:hypothetical protein
VLHAPPISFSILWPARYWVRSTDHSAPHYVIFSIPPLPRPSCTLTLSFTVTLQDMYYNSARHVL